jgi:hypothetical protein
MRWNTWGENGSSTDSSSIVETGGEGKRLVGWNDAAGV